jgi:hypothetical protein
MTIRPPTFDECEALAMLCDRLADRATGYGKTAGDPSVARRFYREAEALQRVVDILAFVGAREPRLHLLLESASARERRFG